MGEIMPQTKATVQCRLTAGSTVARRKQRAARCPPPCESYTFGVSPSLEQRIGDVFSGRADVTAVYLFGSTARGTTHPDSDVDIAVLFRQAPAARLDGARLLLEGELERALGATVDLVVMNDAPADLRMRVLRDGRLLIDRNPSARIAFEVRTRNEAFDLGPVLARYRAPRGQQP